MDLHLCELTYDSLHWDVLKNMCAVHSSHICHEFLVPYTCKNYVAYGIFAIPVALPDGTIQISILTPPCSFDP